jgi:hypothetical protein
VHVFITSLSYRPTTPSNIKVLINENINPQGAVQEIEDNFRLWSRTLSAGVSELLFETTDQNMDLFFESGLTIDEMQKIIESVQQRANGN